MSTPLQTGLNFIERADEWSAEAVALNKVKAKHTVVENALKQKHKDEIDERVRANNSLKTRLMNFAKKHGAKIFSGKETGTGTTKVTNFSLRNNPSKIEKLNKAESDVLLIKRLKDLDYSFAVRHKEEINLEALEQLDDAVLEEIGFIRKHSQSFSIAPAADPTLKK